MTRRTRSRKTFECDILRIINEISGVAVVKVDLNDRLHKKVVDSLSKALQMIMREEPLFHARRPNDVSDNTHENDECLEERIVRYLRERCGINANRLEGKGYPDIEILQDDDVVAYVEVKCTSLSRKSKGSARDFYISPGPIEKYDFKRVGDNKVEYVFHVRLGATSKKVKKPAPHLLVLCKVKDTGISELDKEFKKWELVEYRIYDLYNLKLRIKIEFNTDYKHIEDACSCLNSAEKRSNRILLATNLLSFIS